MAQNNSNVSSLIDLMSKLRAAQGTGSILPVAPMPTPSTTASKIGAVTNNAAYENFKKIEAEMSQQQKNDQAASDIGKSIVDGGVNFIQGTFQLISGLGRGVLNAAADAEKSVLETALKTAAKIKKEGANVGNITGAIAGGLAGAQTAAQQGAVRGIAGSLPVPGVKEGIEKLTGQKVYQDWEQLLTERIPGYKEQGLGLTLDIAGDPTTYLTMGLGGAIKGAAQGVRGLKLAKEAVKTAAGEPIPAEEVAKFVAKNPYNTAIATPKFGNALEAINGGKTSAIRYVLKNARGGFIAAHEQPAIRAAARRAERAIKKAARKETLEIALKSVDNPDFEAVISPSILGERAAAKVSKTVAKIDENTLANLKKIWEAHPDNPAAREAAIKAAIDVEQAATQKAATTATKAIEDKLFAEKALSGTKKVSALIPKTAPKYLDNPDEVFAIAREVETQLLKGEDINLGDLSQRLSPRDLQAVKDIVENPIGYREKGFRKGAALTPSDATLTVGKRQMTAGDLRTVQEAITGTKLSRSVTQFASSKEGLRVMGLISGMGKRLNKSGSKLNPPKALMSMAELEDMFRTPHTFENIPASALWARLSFLAEVSKNTVSDAYEAISKYSDRGFNPLTTIGEHALPSQFLATGKKTAKNPYYLSEIMDAGRTVSGVNYSRELIETLDNAGASVINLLSDGHAVLRPADEVQEILTGALTKAAIKQARAERAAYFKTLQKQFPELTEENVADVLSPSELQTLDAFAANVPDIAMEQVAKFMDELAPTEKALTSAETMLQKSGIDWNGRGAAFRVLSEGRMAFRDLKRAAKSNIDNLRQIYKTVKVFPGKPAPAIGSAAFGEMYTKYADLAKTAADSVNREIAAKIADFIKPFAQSSNELSVDVINKTLSQVSNFIEEGARRATNAQNPFYQSFYVGGKIKGDWIIQTGVQAYKASAKSGSKDKGVFARIVDKRVAETIRSQKINPKTIDKKSAEYQKLLAITFRDWYGDKVYWDGAGLSTWTAMDVMNVTGKANLAALDAEARNLLEKNLPEIVARSQQRVSDYAIKDERLNLDALEASAKEDLEKVVVFGQNLTLPKFLRISEEEMSALYKEYERFSYPIVGEAKQIVDTLLGNSTFANSLKPELKKALLSGSLKVPARREIVKTTMEETALAAARKAGNKESEAYLVRLIQLKKQLSKNFANQFNAQAKRLIENIRAKKLVGKSWPEYATEAAMKQAIKVSGSAAIPNIMSRLFLAESVVMADVAVRSADKVAARARTTGIDMAVENRKFTSILNSAENKIRKTTGLDPIKPNDPRIAEVTPDMFGKGGVYEDNPMMLIAKIRSHVIDPAVPGSKEDWQTYLQLLTNINVTTGEYRALKTINAEALLEPENKDTLKQLAVALARAGDRSLLKRLDEGVTPRLATVEKALTKVKAGSALSPQELEDMVNPRSIAEELDLTAAPQIEEAMAALPADKILGEDLSVTIEAMLRAANKSGQTHIPVIAAAALGRLIERHVTWRQESAREIVTKLGQVLDTNLPVGKPKATLKGEVEPMMRTVEPQSTYTASKVIYQALSDLADSIGLLADSPARAVFMRTQFEDVENLVEAQMARYGLVPAISIKQKTGEAGILELYGVDSLEALQAARPAALRTVYLTTGDIKQALPNNISEYLFYAGTNKSIPETAVAGAVRLAVSLRSELADGKEFSDEIVGGLAQTMFDLIRKEITSNTSISAKKDSNLNFYNLNKDLADKKIETFVVNILQPEVLDNLVVSHIENAAFYLKNARGKVSDYLKDKIDNLAKVINNPVTGSGNKIDAAVKLFNEFERIGGSRQMSDEFKALAQYDLHTTLVAQMAHDDFSVLTSQLFKQKELEDLTGEAAAISKTQKASRKVDPGKVSQKALLIDAEHFMQAYDNSLATNLIKAAEEGTLDEVKAMDGYLEQQASIGQAAYTKTHYRGGIVGATVTAANKVMESMFFGYGSETIKPLIWGSKRTLHGEGGLFSNYVTETANIIKNLDPTRNLELTSFQIVQEMPEDLIAKAAAHHTAIQGALAKTRAAVTAEEAKIGAQVIEEMQPILAKYGIAISDKNAIEAITRTSHLINTIFGGGMHSLVARAGLAPHYLNRMLSEVGGHESRIGFKFMGNPKNLDSFLNQWREIGSENLKVSPLELIRTLHDAMKHAEALPHAAMTLDLKFGVAKSTYGTAEEALKDGYISLAEQTDPNQFGKELLYFMDTDNLYYPAHLVPEIEKAAKDFAAPTRLGKDGANRVITGIDTIQNKVKQNLTILRPGNWVQNTLGGLIMNAYQGVVNPIRYKEALQMLLNNGISPKELESAGVSIKSVDEWGARYAKAASDKGYVIKPTAAGTNTVKVKIKGRTVSYNAQDIFDLYQNKGGSVTSHSVFDQIVQEETATLKQMGKRSEKVIAKVGRGSAHRDNWLRLSLILDRLAKNGGESLSAAMDDALKLANRAHPQPQDLTTFNQKIMKRFILFFTWRAKTQGFLLHELLDRPAPYLTALRAQSAWNQQQGLQTDATDLQPTNLPMRSYNEGFMNPFISLPEGGLGMDPGMYSFSIANPLTDVFGPQSWLSGISLNSYQPMGTQAMNIGINTFKNVFANSDPIGVSLLIDWGWSGTTAQGVNLKDNPDAAPLAVEDLFSRLGLKPYHTLLAQALPSVFKRVSWAGQDTTQVDQAVWGEWVNWLSGIKLKRMDKPADVSKSIAEVMKKLNDYANQQMLKNAEK